MAFSGQCSELKGEAACVQRGCKWYKSDSLLSKAASMARRIPGVGSMTRHGQARCMSQADYKDMWFKSTRGSAMDAAQVAEQDAAAAAGAQRRAEDSQRELEAAQLRCTLKTKTACENMKHCGWVESAGGCNTQSAWMSKANAPFPPRMTATRRSMCAAAGGEWEANALLPGGTCTRKRE